MRRTSRLVVAFVVSSAFAPAVAFGEGGGAPAQPGQPGAGAAAPDGQNSGFVQQGGQPAAPPPPDGQQGAQPGQQPPQQRVNNRQGFDTNLQLGIGLPVVGPLAQSGAWGGALSGFAGWEVRGGLAGIIELGARYHYAGFTNSPDANPGRMFGDIFVGAGGRFTPLREYIIHPFVQATVRFHYMGVAPIGSPLFGNAVPTFGLSFQAGAELDVHESFSLELGLRMDWAFSTHAWSGRIPSGANAATDLVLTPVFGGTIYY